MHPALFAILAGAGIWAGYKWLRKEMARVEADLHETEEGLRRREETRIPDLRQDPETGIYRPSKD
ncbi:MAG: hypothetical protein AB7U38_03085 [Hyphomicrobiales bacterium]